MDYRDAPYLWPQYYNAVLDILGSTGIILAFGDQSRAGKVNAATFEAVGPVGGTAPSDLTWTWSSAPSAWATPFDLTDPANWEGIAPILTFDASANQADTPDDGYFTYDDNGGANGFSMGAWIKIAASANEQVILSKWDPTTSSELREWLFEITPQEELALFVADESANVTPDRTSDAAVTLGAWTFVGVTYDGSGGAAAMDGVTLYENGAVKASTASNSGSYVGMEDLATLPQVGARLGTVGTVVSVMGGSMLGGPLGPFITQAQLTAAQWAELYQIGLAARGKV